MSKRRKSKAYKEKVIRIVKKTIMKEVPKLINKELKRKTMLYKKGRGGEKYKRIIKKVGRKSNKAL